MVSIEIDGQKIEVEPGAMIIEAADAAGISIPRFCYHKKLPIAANCRMCLVDVAKAPKPLPACATPVTDGMKVETKSAKAIDAQKSVMEFLLINHPLDCPICDQAGECELQDVSMGYGEGISQYTEGKRTVKDKDLGPLIGTDMTRCIHCTRCVRFGVHIAGIKELGATGRGEAMEIGTFVERNINSEVSGNVIDLCPVGALTNKPYTNQARSWDLRQQKVISPHDATGSNYFLHTYQQKVVRAVPYDNEAINEIWISDRDRYSHAAIYHEDRVPQAMVRQDGELVATDWVDAFKFSAQSLKEIQKDNGGSSLAALCSPNATVEEFYLLQRIMRDLGSNNIDHRLRTQDFSDQDQAPICPKSAASMSDLEHIDSAVLIGTDIRMEQPIIAIRLRKAVRNNGAAVCTVNPAVYDFHFDVAQHLLCSSADLVAGTAKVLKAVAEAQGTLSADLSKLLTNIKVDEPAKNVAANLLNGDNKVIMLGALAEHSPHAAQVRYLAAKISELTGAKFCQLTSGANSAGAWLAGAVPHRLPAGKMIAPEAQGRNAAELLKLGAKAFIWFNLDPEYDIAQCRDVVRAMEQAEFNLVITPFRSDLIDQYADVVLPLSTFAASSGTLVNFEGRWQSYEGAAKPLGESRPGWKILRVLANVLGLKNYDYMSSQEVLADLKSQSHQLDGLDAAMGSWQLDGALALARDALIRLGTVPIYATDNIARRCKPLQNTILAQESIYAQMNETSAGNYGFRDGDNIKIVQNGQSAVMQLRINNNIADQVLVAPSAIKQTVALGNPYGTVEIQGG